MPDNTVYSPQAFITTSVFGGNLGDTLWVSSLARYINKDALVVQMRSGDSKARATAPILDGLARVEWIDNPAETPRAQIRAHVTQQILTRYHLGGRPSVPRVLFKPEEIQWAIGFLKDKGLNPARTVAFTNHNSANGDPTNYRAQYVRPPSETIKTLARFWGGQNKIVQFGPEQGYYTHDPFESIPNAVEIRGLTVRQLAACYHVIGKLVSGDSGDYHLMLAVGGRAAVLVPPHSDQMGYRHWDLLYDQVCWGEERPRVRYALHQDYFSFMRTDLFNDLS